jgi:replication factor C small subunit
MRRAINVLQAASAMGKVTIETVYKVVGMARPREVREMLKQALSGDFTGARNLMRKLMLEYGLSGEDIVRQVHREIFSQEVNIPEELRVMIADYLGEIHFRLIEGSDDDIQLSALLAWLALMGKRLK